MSSNPRSGAGSCPSRLLAALLLAGLALAAGAAPPQISLPAPDTALPVDLQADFSEFDRKNNRLVFRGLRITQGQLLIQADEATASPADFTDSVWTFTGKVLIRNADTEATCDHAELTFRDNALRTAVLNGTPARFTQPRLDQRPPAQGRATTLTYDLEAGTIRMDKDAWLSDGTNEITGNEIAYDLRRELVTAGADQSGQVRMKITPPKKPKS